MLKAYKFRIYLNQEQQIQISKTFGCLPQTDKKVGMDLGIKDLCITSDGKKYENPKTLRKYEKRLAKAQCQFAHKQKLSNN